MKGKTPFLRIPRIGELLLRHRLVNRSQLAAAIRTQRRSDKRLGEILVDQQVISRSQLSLSLRRQTLMRCICVAATLILTPLLSAQAQSQEKSRSDMLPSMGAGLKTESVDLVKTLEKRFNSPLLTLLKGEYKGGVDKNSEGLRYKAEWSEDSVMFEVKYQF
ncbi:hypothetical protein FKG94_07090 [Exilibacterium tricleocarpae]|uniref:Uncharacterized protein n=1 Tax=Exilibacterium tricleocarpae TaxID=2591008 RepID=A0A545TZ57_9GAMM|nr:hypothetical protein [Exilibacterium tricleocarpae]TQV82498.1 hypothetical protein FKG94_07090 [Exilibacterium tricleocarpae]